MTAAVHRLFGETSVELVQGDVTVAPGLERVKVVRFVLWEESGYDAHVRVLEMTEA